MSTGEGGCLGDAGPTKDLRVRTVDGWRRNKQGGNLSVVRAAVARRGAEWPRYLPAVEAASLPLRPLRIIKKIAWYGRNNRASCIMHNESLNVNRVSNRIAYCQI